jgi:hypothetical protein
VTKAAKPPRGRRPLCHLVFKDHDPNMIKVPVPIKIIKMISRHELELTDKDICEECNIELMR